MKPQQLNFLLAFSSTVQTEYCGVSVDVFHTGRGGSDTAVLLQFLNTSVSMQS